MFNRHPSFIDWNRAVGNLFAQLHSVDFPALMFDVIGSQIDFNMASCCCLIDGSAIMLDEVGVTPEQRHSFAEAYVSGAYLLDPVYHAFRDGLPTGCYRLSELAPDDFYQSEYYRSYYERLGFVDDVYFVSVLSGDNMISFAVSRSQGHPQFTDQEMRRLKEIEPVVCQASLQFFLKLDRSAIPQDHTSPAVQKQLEAAYKCFGTSILTERECELVHLLLRGHSNQSAADKMRITKDTVKMHRKNINSKLDISSQAELFSLFIGSLSCLPNKPDQDPLTIYLNNLA